MSHRLTLACAIAAITFAWTAPVPAADAAKPGAADAANAGAADSQTKQLLLLMDQDRNGKISKAEFMAFMEAEFTRLDVNNDGQLDVAELTGLRIRRSRNNHHYK